MNTVKKGRRFERSIPSEENLTSLASKSTLFDVKSLPNHSRSFTTNICYSFISVEHSSRSYVGSKSTRRLRTSKTNIINTFSDTSTSLYGNLFAKLHDSESPGYKRKILERMDTVDNRSSPCLDANVRNPEPKASLWSSVRRHEAITGNSDIGFLGSRNRLHPIAAGRASFPTLARRRRLDLADGANEKKKGILSSASTSRSLRSLAMSLRFFGSK